MSHTASVRPMTPPAFQATSPRREEAYNTIVIDQHCSSCYGRAVLPLFASFIRYRNRRRAARVSVRLTRRQAASATRMRLASR